MHVQKERVGENTGRALKVNIKLKVNSIKKSLNKLSQINIIDHKIMIIVIQL